MMKYCVVLLHSRTQMNLENNEGEKPDTKAPPQCANPCTQDAQDRQITVTRGWGTEGRGVTAPGDGDLSLG